MGIPGKGYGKGYPAKGKKGARPGGKGKRPETGPVPPLDDQSILHLKAFVQAEGGSCILGKMCHDFEGLKKAQLEGHFEFTRLESSDQWEVMLLMEDEGEDFSQHLLPPGKHRLEGMPESTLEDEWHMPDPAPAYGVREPQGREPARHAREADRGRGAPPPDAEPLPELDPQQVEEITAFLEEHGGALPLGRVCQQFMGLKRPQLEGSFELNRVGAHGQWEVRLPGADAPPAEMMFDGQGVARDAQLPDLNEEQIGIITDAILESEEKRLTLMEVIRACPGIKRQQLHGHFEVHKVDKKHFNVGILRKFDYDNPQRAGGKGYREPRKGGKGGKGGGEARQSEPVAEAPPLDDQAIDDIAATLNDMGGSAPMGKLSANFKFLKLSQLEGVFHIQRVGDQWMVSLTPFSEPAGGKGGKSKGKGKGKKGKWEAEEPAWKRQRLV